MEALMCMTIPKPDVKALWHDMDYADKFYATCAHVWSTIWNGLQTSQFAYAFYDLPAAPNGNFSRRVITRSSKKDGYLQLSVMTFYAGEDAPVMEGDTQYGSQRAFITDMHDSGIKVYIEV